MKKSQFFLGRPLILVLISIISLSVILFGAKSIKDIKTKATEYEVFRFQKSIGNTLERFYYREVGDFEEQTFTIPEEINEVCFIDLGSTANPVTNIELFSLAETYEDYNLFIYPLDKFRPFKLKYLALNESDNPLCIKNTNKRVKLKFTALGNKTMISTSSSQDKDIDCVSLVINGDPEDKIDIVFLGYGYKEVDEFSKDINTYVEEVIFNIEPFKSNQDKFNFYRVDKFLEEGCTITNFIRCDEFMVKKVASQCPNDHIFVLTDRNTIANFFRPIRSSAISNMIKVNTADNKFVVIHEFGHTFGGLADEYVDDNYYKGINFIASEYPNCDIPSCPKLEEEECFKGCSTSSYYRGTRTSIMRDLDEEYFGPINEKEIQNKLNYYEE